MYLVGISNRVWDQLCGSNSTLQAETHIYKRKCSQRLILAHLVVVQRLMSHL